MWIHVDSALKVVDLVIMAHVLLLDIPMGLAVSNILQKNGW